MRNLHYDDSLWEQLSGRIATRFFHPTKARMARGGMQGAGMARCTSRAAIEPVLHPRCPCGCCLVGAAETQIQPWSNKHLYPTAFSFKAMEAR